MTAPGLLLAYVAAQVPIGRRGHGLFTHFFFSPLGLVAWALLALSLPFVFMLWRRSDHVTIIGGDVQPSRRANGWVPGASIDGVEIRSWSNPAQGIGVVRASLRLTSGRFVPLPPLERAKQTWRRPGALQISTSADPRWRPLIGADGRIIPWSAGTDREVAETVEALLATSPAGAHGGRIFEPKPSSLESTPLTPPAPAPAPIAPSDLPAWTDLGLPARYWTLKSSREPSLFGRRPWLGFSARGIVRARPAWRRTIPYAEVDRFDFTYSDEDGWRMVLLCKNGRTLSLTGLSYGLFRGNQLYRRVAGQPSIARNGATAVLPWDDDADALALARLNAHLEHARRGV